MGERRSNRHDDHSEDNPQYSRLFIVCTKQHTEEDLKAAFADFGTIEDVKMPRDRNSGDVKGVCYIKFSKTSEAANALEAMHAKKVGTIHRPIKVMVAAGRSEIANDDDEKYRRLFITIPKTATEKEIRDDFSVYGQVDSVIIQKNRATGENRGFAYVKFRKFSAAAYAFEEADKKYRPIFATPKNYGRNFQETPFESNINMLSTPNTMMGGGIQSMMNCKPEGFTRLRVQCSPFLTQNLIGRLFDIIPGMEHCQYTVDLMREFGKAIIVYSNPVSAAYARDKFNNFEYPPGQPIFVQPETSRGNVNSNVNSNAITTVVNNLKSAMNKGGAAPDLAELADAIAQASSLIKAATTGVTDTNVNDLNYCSVKLPPPQPLADIDSLVAQRCFIVCRPQPPPLTVLKDIFCRFGDLINVYTLPNKTVGYARYASKSAAEEAMKVLHGSEVCGVRMKVLEADERPEFADDNETHRKRMRVD